MEGTYLARRKKKKKTLIASSIVKTKNCSISETLTQYIFERPK